MRRCDLYFVAENLCLESAGGSRATAVCYSNLYCLVYLERSRICCRVGCLACSALYFPSALVRYQVSSGVVLLAEPFYRRSPFLVGAMRILGKFSSNLVAPTESDYHLARLTQ